MTGNMLELATADGPMQAYEARPDGEPRGGVVVVHDAFGVGPPIEAMCDLLVAHGYAAIAPQFFHRQGVLTADMSIGFEAILDLFPLDDETLMDVDAAADHLADTGIDRARMGVVGFCFGGRASFLVAAQRTFAAAVGFYGNGIIEKSFAHRAIEPISDAAPSMHTPWLGVFGDDDGLIPVDGVERLRVLLDEQCPVDHEVARYADQGHAFVHQGADQAPLAGDALHAWNRALAWLDAYVPA